MDQSIGEIRGLVDFQSPCNSHQLARNSSGTALESNYHSSHILSIAEYHANSFLRFIMLVQMSVVCSPSTHPRSRYKHSGQLQRDTERLLTTGLGEDPWGDWDCFGCWRYLVVTGQIHYFFHFPINYSSLNRMQERKMNRCFTFTYLKFSIPHLLQLHFLPASWLSMSCFKFTWRVCLYSRVPNSTFSHK